MTTQIHYTFKHMAASEAIKSNANKKVQKATKLDSLVNDIHFIFEVEKLTHRAELIFQTSHGKFVSHHSSENLYHSIDAAIDKMVHQITKDKGNHSNHKH